MGLPSPPCSSTSWGWRSSSDCGPGSQVRRTGWSGFHGISGKPGSLRGGGPALLRPAHVLGVGTLVLAVVDVVSRPSGTVADTVGVIGLVLALRGFAGVLAAQTEMPTTSLRCA
jgi:hypothetical protein